MRLKQYDFSVGALELRCKERMQYANCIAFQENLLSFMRVLSNDDNGSDNGKHSTSAYMKYSKMKCTSIVHLDFNWFQVFFFVGALNFGGAHTHVFFSGRVSAF